MNKILKYLEKKELITIIRDNESKEIDRNTILKENMGILPKEEKELSMAKTIIEPKEKNTLELLKPGVIMNDSHNINEKEKNNSQKESIDIISFLEQKSSSMYGESIELREKILIIKEKNFELKIFKQSLVDHKIFKEIKTLTELQQFMSWHVFAVWDFMSLIKRLQQDLTCTSVPWLPNKHEYAAHLINEIVLGEESDMLPDGTGFMSHFAIYLEAMKEVGANTKEIELFIQNLQNKMSLEKALESQPQAIKDFVGFTIKTAQFGTVYEVLGSFFHGRENVIPDMFTSLLNEWQIDEKKAPMFVYYLKRHIELDSGEHGPAAEKVINIVTENNPDKIIELLNCSIESVKMRIKLWDSIYNLIKK